jgi:Uma2 family endonuclease
MGPFTRYNETWQNRFGNVSKMQNLNSIAPTSVPTFGRETDDDPRFGPKQFHWTSDEYYRIAELGVFEGKRVELIEGEIIEMAPMGSIHATGLSLVNEVLREHFRQGFHIRSQAPLDVDDFSQPEPDVGVVKGVPRDYLRLTQERCF